MAAAGGEKIGPAREQIHNWAEHNGRGRERSVTTFLPALEWLIFNKADPLRLIYTRRGDNFVEFFVQIS